VACHDLPPFERILENPMVDPGLPRRFSQDPLPFVIIAKNIIQNA